MSKNDKNKQENPKAVEQKPKLEGFLSTSAILAPQQSVNELRSTNVENLLPQDERADGKHNSNAVETGYTLNSKGRMDVKEAGLRLKGMIEKDVPYSVSASFEDAHYSQTVAKGTGVSIIQQDWRNPGYLDYKTTDQRIMTTQTAEEFKSTDVHMRGAKVTGSIGYKKLQGGVVLGYGNIQNKAVNTGAAMFEPVEGLKKTVTASHERSGSFYSHVGANLVLDEARIRPGAKISVDNYAMGHSLYRDEITQKNIALFKSVNLHKPDRFGRAANLAVEVGATALKSGIEFKEYTDNEGSNRTQFDTQRTAFAPYGKVTLTVPIGR